MEQEELITYIIEAENQMLDLSATLATLKAKLNYLIEENNQLKMTNHDLHDTLLSYEKEVSPTPESHEINSGPSKGGERLQAYYDEGIHICHSFFGAPREDQEECILCLGVLDEMHRDG